ncbi:MAG: cytochrome b/b6 domain-containing protein [Gammaproteobacteria bacterium]|jgi:Ni/Fe-hydrogenase 1 B-type cytochrome subunit|nr:cytochrome b/b6 domain-containing protein [Gammaproteobacteria bacterium]
MSELNVKEYKVWDLPTRLFHWINVFSILALMFLGLVMLNKGALGIQSMEAKIALKQVHVIIGYVFTINLLWRVVWGFLGNRYAGWSEIIPGRNYLSDLRSYLKSVKTGSPKQFIGHNPAGKLSVMVFYLILVIMAVTGLIRAGTDIYFPPFGTIAAEYVAKDGVDPASMLPYDKTNVNPEKYKALKTFKKPIGVIHIYLSYFLMFMVLIHIVAVVKAELSGSHGLASAMLSGRKRIAGTPEDGA